MSCFIKYKSFFFFNIKVDIGKAKAKPLTDIKAN